MNEAPANGANGWQQYWPFSPNGTLLILLLTTAVVFLLVLKYSKSMRRLMKLLSSLLEGFLQDHPVWSILILTGLTACLVKNIKPDLTVVDLLGICGVFISGVGLYYTNIQIKFTNDRIETFDAFYKQANALLKDVAKKQNGKIYFYGPTILPGNVSAGKHLDQAIAEYEGIWRDIFVGGRHASYNGVELRVLTPTESQYERLYSAVLQSTDRASLTSEEFSRFRLGKLNDAMALVKALRGARTDSFVDVPERYHSEISGEYFLSNGERAIFVKPLHYVSARPSDSKSGVRPTLAGFTTTDSTTVAAFHDYFERLWTTCRHGPLQAMYSCHFRKPAYIAKMTNRNPDCPFLHDHFGGPAATLDFINTIGNGRINPGEVVLDIGSGYGGPARMIANHFGCKVWGVELQSERGAIAANSVTKGENVTLLCTDATSAHFWSAVHFKFDHAISFLALLHIDGKRTFLRTLSENIARGGYLYLEEIFARRTLAPSESRQIENTISSPELLTDAELRAAIVAAGFSIEQWKDQTEVWKKLVQDRVVEFDRDAQQLIQDATPDDFNRGQVFNRGVQELFDKGIVGGAKILAKRL